MKKTLLLALPLLSSCATTASPARCAAPASTPPVVAETSPSPARATPVAQRLARLPDGAEALLRVDMQQLFATRFGRMVAPFLVWSDAYRPLREACTERPWELAPTVEGFYQDRHVAAALVGSVASPTIPCAARVFEGADLSTMRVQEDDAVSSLVVGDDAGRAALREARAGRGTAEHDAAFRDLPPGLAAPLMTLILRGSAYRDAVDFVDTLADEASSRTHDGGPIPRVTLQTRATLRALRSVRVEAALVDGHDLDVRIAMLFPTSDEARGYVAASQDDMRTSIPRMVTQFIERDMRSNPDAARLGQAFGAELSSWLLDVAPASAQGPVVEYSFRTGDASLVTLGALAAVAVPAFTRYVKRSKTAEAVGNLRIITEALATELNQTPPARRRLVPIAATPTAAPSATAYAPDASRWTTPAWRRAGFAIEGRHYYQYRVDVDARCYVVTAEGDLDGDGDRSSFSMRVCPGAGGVYATSPITIHDELE